MSVGRKNGKLFVTSGSDEQLVTYQRAVKDLMEAEIEPDLQRQFLANETPVKLTFYYTRKLGKGVAEADSTNLTKALEDALQGILYKNDRLVNNICGVILAQREDLDCEPFIVIHIEDGYTDLLSVVEDWPKEFFERMLKTSEILSEEEDDLSWPPRK